MNGTITQLSISPGGIPKRAILTGVVEELGLVGDSHAHPQYHGGPRQALLLITSEGIEELVAVGYPLYPGALGENVTTKGLDRRQWRIGQRWWLGESVLIEFTKMRVPCNTLSPYGRGIQAAVYDDKVKANDATSPRWALSGMYAKVLRGGAASPGDTIRLAEPEPKR
ncbi:MAG: MOSC domain-containing protein [Bryobacteraceae bacterium]